MSHNPVDYCLQAVIVLNFQHIAVLVDGTEPEREEVILNRIADILCGTLLKEGLLLGNDLILVFQLGQVSADFPAHNILYFRTGVLPLAIADRIEKYTP